MFEALAEFGFTAFFGLIGFAIILAIIFIILIGAFFGYVWVEDASSILQKEFGPLLSPIKIKIRKFMKEISTVRLVLIGMVIFFDFALYLILIDILFLGGVYNF